MRIAEIHTRDQQQQLLTKNDENDENDNHHQEQQSLLSRIESLILQIENLSGVGSHSTIPETVADGLRQTVTELGHLTPFQNSTKLQIWKLSFRLHNACIDISNFAATSRSPSASVMEQNAALRHLAADMLFLASDVTGVPSPAIKSASFYYKAGTVWFRLERFDLASSCFERATEMIANIELSKVSHADERKLLLDISLARSRAAWELSDKNLAVTLLNRAKKTLLFNSSDHYKRLAGQYVAFGRNELSRTEASGTPNEALKLMNEALNLAEKGAAAARTRDQSIALNELKFETLRFIAAAHLKRGEYESVIKCVKFLREGGGEDGGAHHAALCVLAMRGWLGLERYGEAEKELRGLVVNNDIPESVWVSSIEAYFNAVGGIAGAEVVKGVFMGLLGRCHVSAGAAVRLARRVLGDSSFGGVGVGGDELRVRARVVAELVSDDRVVALFSGEGAAKERSAMHTVLWNCGSQNFNSRDYKMSAEMFEKSLLYVPRDTESRVHRAKGFRVLCLCYLGLCLLDQAQEYINEADKLEPNVVSAFLKFKIYLQKGDHSSAVNQIQVLTACLDFTPDFLSLSAHEAIACRALPVAVACFSSMLNFYTSGKNMSTPEVVVLRTLITILAQEPGHEEEVLKFMKRAHARSNELGTEYFFGKGEAGGRERNWISVNSWNHGINCGKQQKYDLCAEFLRLAVDFHPGSVDGKTGDTNVPICKSLILMVSAIVASENQRKIPLVESELKEALELIDRAEKMLDSITTGNQLGEDKNDPDLIFMYTVNAYEIYGRIDNSGSQRQLVLVKNYVNSKACNPKYLLQLGLNATQGPRSNPEVATFALNECLSSLLASPSPDYKDIALVVRRLIALASIQKGKPTDDAVQSMYEMAYRTMIGLKEGEYPTEEVKWLATSAWNRAALPMRLGQIDVAKKWMSLGLEISRKIGGMETYRACMEDYVANLEKKLTPQR